MADPMDLDLSSFTLYETVLQVITEAAAKDIYVVDETGLIFTPFAHLPLELRTMVWEFSLNGRRLIVVKVRHRNVWPKKRVYIDPYSRAVAVPALLHTSREARSMALKRFVPMAGRWGKPVYFDFKNDILRVEAGAMPELCGASSGFQFAGTSFLLPIDVREWHVSLHHLELTNLRDWKIDTKALQWMKSLKTLTIEMHRKPNLGESLAEHKKRKVDALNAKLAEHWLGPRGNIPRITFHWRGTTKQLRMAREQLITLRRGFMLTFSLEQENPD